MEIFFQHKIYNVVVHRGDQKSDELIDLWTLASNFNLSISSQLNSYTIEIYIQRISMIYKAVY